MKFLNTYACKKGGVSQMGMDITDDPIEWIADCQQFSETYVLLNAQPITDEQAEKYNGAFKGM